MSARLAALIVFVKAPAPGHVKTRLLSRYTPEQATDIYTAFVRDTLSKARHVEASDHVVCYAPSDAGESIAALVGTNWKLRPQTKGDLGKRMAVALRECFDDGADRAILMGTDIPSLPQHHLSNAFDLLNGHEIVIGPSTDGGYYLVGARSDHPSIFEDIEWSTSRVFKQTVERVEAADLSLGLLPPWYDVDTPDEVDFLVAHSVAGGDAKWVPHHTLAAVAELDGHPT